MHLRWTEAVRCKKWNCDLSQIWALFSSVSLTANFYPRTSLACVHVSRRYVSTCVRYVYKKQANGLEKVTVSHFSRIFMTFSSPTPRVFDWFSWSTFPLLIFPLSFFRSHFIVFSGIMALIGSPVMTGYLLLVGLLSLRFLSAAVAFPRPPIAVLPVLSSLVFNDVFVNDSENVTSNTRKSKDSRTTTILIANWRQPVECEVSIDRLIEWFQSGLLDRKSDWLIDWLTDDLRYFFLFSFYISFFPVVFPAFSEATTDFPTPSTLFKRANKTEASTMTVPPKTVPTAAAAQVWNRPGNRGNLPQSQRWLLVIRSRGVWVSRWRGRPAGAGIVPDHHRDHGGSYWRGSLCPMSSFNGAFFHAWTFYVCDAFLLRFFFPVSHRDFR